MIPLRARFAVLTTIVAAALGVAIAYDQGLVVAVSFAFLIVLVTLGTRYAGTVLVGLAGLYLVLNERTAIKVPGFGSGIVPVLASLVVVLAFAVLVARPKQGARALGLVLGAHGVLWFVGGAVLLPILGVITGYPARTLLAVLVPLVMFAFLYLGALLKDHFDDFWTVAFRLLAIVGGVEFAAGLLQGLVNLGISTPLSAPMRRWDTVVGERYGLTLASGRSLGLFVNPNVFALFGGLLFVAGLYGRRIGRTRRAVMLVCGMGIVLLGASRGVMLGVLVAVFVEQMYRHITGAEPSLDISRRLAACGLLLATVLSAGSAVARGLLARFLYRLWIGAGMLSFGLSADSSASGRLTFWKASVDLLRHHPMGTLGPPELLLGTAVDSDYVRIFLQGGLLFALAYLAALFTVYRVARSSENGAVLRGVVVVIAIAGLTQTSVTYVPAVLLLWLLTGAAVAEQATVPAPSDGVEAAGYEPVGFEGAA